MKQKNWHFIFVILVVQMLRSLSPFIVLTALGLILFTFEIWGTSAPKTADPDIGAGILSLLSIVIIVFGEIGILISSKGIVRRS